MEEVVLWLESEDGEEWSYDLHRGHGSHSVTKRSWADIVDDHPYSCECEKINMWMSKSDWTFKSHKLLIHVEGYTVELSGEEVETMFSKSHP